MPTRRLFLLITLFILLVVFVLSNGNFLLKDYSKFTADLSGPIGNEEVISNYGGVNSPKKSINYMPYMFVDCPNAGNREAWVQLLKRLNIKQALFAWCFVLGDMVPNQGSLEQLRDTVSYFKANGISVAMHHYADLIAKNSQLAQDQNNIRRNPDNTLMERFGAYVPTPSTSIIIAQKMADTYNFCGFDAGIYFDAVDYYAFLKESSTALSFMKKVVKSIPGGCPVDAATTWTAGDNLYSRRGTIDSPPGNLKAFADEHSAFVIDWIKKSTYPFVPFMGWLNVDGMQTFSVDDLKYYLEKCRSMGGSYGLEGVTPANQNNSSLAPFLNALAEYNKSWNIKIIAVKNSSGSALAGAAVRISNNNGQIFNSATNAAGFVAANIADASGPYTIKIEYNSKEQEIKNNLISDLEFVFDPCNPNWQCTSWSSCNPASSGNLVKTRTCSDLNSCSININKPAESQLCVSVEPITPITPVTPIIPATPTITAFTKPLYYKLRDPEVTTLQTFLAKDKNIYPEGKVTGYFGVLTFKAVGRFQLKYSLVKGVNYAGYGLVGPKTRAKLNELYK